MNHLRLAGVADQLFELAGRLARDQAGLAAVVVRQATRQFDPGERADRDHVAALELAPHPLWTGLPPQPHVYYVHSYYCDPIDPGVVIASTEYGEKFAAAAARGPVAGVQFHPEKSQAVGLTILKNFLEWK